MTVQHRVNMVLTAHKIQAVSVSHLEDIGPEMKLFV